MRAEDKTRDEAAAHLREKLGLSIGAVTLATYASIGCGPAYYKRGNRVYYPVASLNDWGKSKISQARSKASELHHRGEAA